MYMSAIQEEVLAFKYNDMKIKLWILGMSLFLIHNSSHGFSAIDSSFTYQAFIHPTDDGFDVDITLEEVPDGANVVFILFGDNPDMSNILALEVNLLSESTSEKYIIHRQQNSIQIKIFDVPEEFFHSLHYKMSDGSMVQLISR